MISLVADQTRREHVKLMEKIKKGGKNKIIIYVCITLLFISKNHTVEPKNAVQHPYRKERVKVLPS